MDPLRVVEICAGAGGSALGLENAGFAHELAVELDPNAAATLRLNRPAWDIRVGDVADPQVWRPAEFRGVDLFAGGVPCPPFSIAGRQLGSADERDLFAWAVEQAGALQSRAVILENVRGLSMPRFAGYRQHVLDRFAELGYLADWRLLNASDFGLAQLRPRFVLVALRPEDAPYFKWPEPLGDPPTVGEALVDLMHARLWAGAGEWMSRANGIGPTIVGGSKKHGGADLGPTRAKKAWRALGVDAHGVADAAPGEDTPLRFDPKFTIPMVARLQGWEVSDGWQFTGRKTSQYRQIGNAFPPPMAEAVGAAVLAALRHDGEPSQAPDLSPQLHDPVLRILKDTSGYVRRKDLLINVAALRGDETSLDTHLDRLLLDFTIDVKTFRGTESYRLLDFRGFVGQEDHHRHVALAVRRRLIS